MTAQVPPEGESSENDVSLQWPGALPRNKVKRLAKVWLGRLVSRLAPGKAERVRQGAMDMSPTLAQRLMLAFRAGPAAADDGDCERQEYHQGATDQKGVGARQVRHLRQ